MALPINIENLINAQVVESVRIEFKKGWNPEEVLHSMCAYANDINEYGGGYIIIGIEEVDGSPKLPPSGVQLNQIDRIQKEFLHLCFHIKPNIFPVVEPIEFMGQSIIIIWVTTGEERPYSAPSTLGAKGQRKIYIRPASASIPATSVHEKKLRELANDLHFDDRINAKANIGDLDLGLIQAYLDETKSSLYAESFKLSISELAIKMQIARGPKENIKPLNVALMLFNKEPHKFFEGCVTNLIEFQNEAGTKIGVTKTFTGPIHFQIRDILDYFKNNIINKYIIKNNSKAESDSFFNYPFLALREAVVNAFHHRGYDDPMPNEIRIYKSFEKGFDKFFDPRQVQIRSFPGPKAPIDEKALAELKILDRRYRNIRLGDMLKQLNLLEKFATGIPQMVEALSKNGSPLPILSTDAEKTFFLALIKIHESTPLETNDEAIIFERISLSDIQQRILERFVEEPIAESELSLLFGSNTKDEIQFLLTKKLLNSKNYNNDKIYFITNKGRESLKNSF